VVDVEGYEGPLDLLLALARQQKVDLAKISILALADQYLVFIEAARKIRLELAADYLVMAAWLAFLKSRLLLPEPATPDGPSAEEMATALANRLRRLEAIREASNRLMNRPQLQRDIFRAAIRNRSRKSSIPNSPRRCSTCSPPMPRSASSACWQCASGQAHGVVADRSARVAGAAGRHGRGLEPPRRIPAQLRRRSLAKGHRFRVELCAALELVREGEVELHQKEAFAPLYFRKRPPQPASDAMTAPDLPAE
jgi:segregation and condensation protein A